MNQETKVIDLGREEAKVRETKADQDENSKEPQNSPVEPPAKSFLRCTAKTKSRKMGKRFYLRTMISLDVKNGRKMLTVPKRNWEIP